MTFYVNYDPILRSYRALKKQRWDTSDYFNGLKFNALLSRDSLFFERVFDHLHFRN